MTFSPHSRLFLPLRLFHDTSKERMKREREKKKEKTKMKTKTKKRREREGREGRREKESDMILVEAFTRLVCASNRSKRKKNYKRFEKQRKFFSQWHYTHVLRLYLVEIVIIKKTKFISTWSTRGKSSSSSRRSR